MLDSILGKINRTARGMKRMFPHITKRGRWRTTADGGWTGGYWVGLLWLAYAATKHEKYRKWAHKWASLLAPKKKEPNPDLGHPFYPSFVLGYRITGDAELRKIALEAADTLTTCFNEKSGFIYKEIRMNGGKAGRALIDFMTTLPLLWWAYEETDDKRHYDVAHRHSTRTVEEFIRSDGSSFHVIDFDLKTGRVIRKTTWQGHSVNSCWSRGQAWAIYGFTLAYEATKDETFLSVAEKLADYFIKNLPADHVPHWDFNDPKIPDVPRDSSAAAIACSGLMTLSKLSGRNRFRDAADKILNSLSTNYIAEENHDGILKHGCFHMPKKDGVDESLIWGDFYFVEALLKKQGKLG